MPEQQKYFFFDVAGMLGDLWCSLMHDSPMWPIHGGYQCRICGRSYSVPWAGEPQRPPARLMAANPARIQQGRHIVESGAYHQLLPAGGLYSKDSKPALPAEAIGA